MHPLIQPAWDLLGLPLPTSSNAQELTETLLSELLEDSQREQTQEQALQTLHCTATDPNEKTNFLLNTVLAHRILLHKTPTPEYREEDGAFADALSRLTTALSLGPQTVTKSTLPSYITALQSKLPSPQNTLVSSLNADQISALEDIQSRLHAEHLTRVELLLTRLGVTVSAFARSGLSQDSFFFDNHIDTMRRNARAVSLYQAIAASDAILKEPKRRRTTDDVKNFLMGAVPDRGGRLEGPHMPAFKQRVPAGAELKTERLRGRKMKGKGTGKGRRR